MNRILYLTTAVIAVLAGAAFAQTSTEPKWWDETPWRSDDRAFHYYPEPPKTPVKALPPVVEPVPLLPPPARRFEDMASVKEAREEHDRLLDVAVITPTPANVLAYHEFKTKLLAQSEKFSAVSQSVIWANPSIDYNATNPVANFAQTSQRIQKNRDEEQLMRDLAKTHGIIFFFRGSCGPCHAQAPILKQVAQRYGIEVMAVSLDGGSIPGLENARLDNGISKAVTGGRGVEMTPMSFLVSRDYKDIVMLGAGVLAEDEILNRVRLLKTRSAETMYTPYWANQSDPPTQAQLKKAVK